MSDKKKSKPQAQPKPQPKVEATLREDINQAMAEEERQRILAEQAPRLEEAKRRQMMADAALGGQQQTMQTPAEEAVEVPPQAQQVVQPADKPLSPDETGGIVNALRQYEPFKTMHALITKNARTADKQLKQGE